MTRPPADAAKDLSSLLSEVGAALYAVDNDTDTAFVRNQADAGSQAAADIVASLASAWEQYALAKDASDRLDAAVAARHTDAIDDLLGPTAVTLPGGTTTGVAALLLDLREELSDLADQVAHMADAARQALTRLDAARNAARELLVRAGAAGADGDVELDALRSAIERATTGVASDPTGGGDLAGIEQFLDAAARRVEAVERSREGLPDALSAASAQLEEIEALVVQAADAASLARNRILSPDGLVTPPDLSSGGGQALRPWLDRIRGQADSGEWEHSSAALVAWQRAADVRLADARRAVEANAAPVAHRNELRGLLDAYRAKASAHGRDEDGRLARLHTAARDALYTAPCALDASDRLVREYVEAVNTAAAGVDQ